MQQPRDNVLPFPQAPDAIELRHLRAFVAVAEELSFSRAADRLYLSQSALSRQISSLERLVGCQLLRRSTHRVELTLAGEALLERARPVLKAVDEAVAMTQSVGGELVGRMARLLEPVGDLLAAGAELDDVRDAFEALHAQFSPPPEIGVRPVNANGVPSLLLSPAPEQPATILYLHGGAFVLGSAFGYRHLGGALAAAAETGTLVADFRLAPEHPFPAALDDALAAYRWIVDRGIPPHRIAVAGDSSGGLIVLSLLVALKQRGLPLPGGAVLLCPLVDLRAGLEHAAPDHRDQLGTWTAGYLGGHPLEDPVVSPLLADLSGLPPTLVQAATGDDLLAQAHRFTEHARRCGVDARLELYATATHGFQFFWSFLPEAADAIHEAGRFARELAGAEPARVDSSR